jgi:glycosyltransferase involved in cell wall biosynthesis
VRIRVLGQRNVLGGGIHFAEFSDQLKQISYVKDLVDEVDVALPNWIERQGAGFADDDVNIWFYPTDTAAKLGGHHVCWAIFETDKLPAWYRDFMLHVPEVIWSPSEWGRSILIQHGIPQERIDVIPEGVNTRLFHPFSRAPRSTPIDRRFRLLMIGKLEDRKGYAELFEALARLIENKIDLELIVKGDYFLRQSEKAGEMRALIQRWNVGGSVRIIEGVWRPEEMIALYNHADAFVFPSKAEGWGLPLIEALAAATPAIATCCTGHQHYLSKVEGMFSRIETSHQLIADRDYFSFWPDAAGLGGSWNKPSVESIVTQVQTMIERYAERSEFALTASQLIRREFSWENSVSMALGSIQSRGWLSLSVDLLESP